MAKERRSLPHPASLPQGAQLAVTFRAGKPRLKYLLYLGIQTTDTRQDKDNIFIPSSLLPFPTFSVPVLASPIEKQGAC